jgi:hypothetical protein
MSLSRFCGPEVARLTEFLYQAAINAGYGSGDGCSAYGNRNFWLYYTDWFGSTNTPNYWWQPQSQTVHTDQTKSQALNQNTLVQGDRVYMTVQVKNAGVATWYKNSVNLATSGPQNRLSDIYDSSWLSNSRPATMKESSVAPGSTATFEFWANTSAKSGNLKEYFNLVVEGVTWMNDMGLHYALNVQPARYDIAYQGQGAYSDESGANRTDLADIKPGQRYYLSVNVKNTGNTTWRPGAVNLGTSGPRNRGSGFYDQTWLSASRPGTIDRVVAPGQSGNFSFWVTAPYDNVTRQEYFQPVAENITWLEDRGLYWQFTVR